MHTSGFMFQSWSPTVQRQEEFISDCKDSIRSNGSAEIVKLRGSGETLAIPQKAAAPILKSCLAKKRAPHTSSDSVGKPISFLSSIINAASRRKSSRVRFASHRLVHGVEMPQPKKQRESRQSLKALSFTLHLGIETRKRSLMSRQPFRTLVGDFQLVTENGEAWKVFRTDEEMEIYRSTVIGPLRVTLEAWDAHYDDWTDHLTDAQIRRNNYGDAFISSMFSFGDDSAEDDSAEDESVSEVEQQEFIHDMEDRADAITTYRRRRLQELAKEAKEERRNELEKCLEVIGSVMVWSRGGLSNLEKSEFYGYEVQGSWWERNFVVDHALVFG